MTETNDSGTDPGEQTARQLVEGWQGRYFEDFTVGDIYKHPFGRTVTETDNVWLTNLTMNLNPMHFNEAYAAGTEFGERLVDGTFVIALAVGMSVIDVSVNATANLGYDDIRHHAPVFHGDTISAESEVLDKRESDSRDHVGIVTTELRAYNQDDELVLSLERTPMVLKRAYAEPTAAQPPGWPAGIGTHPEEAVTTALQPIIQESLPQNPRRKSPCVPMGLTPTNSVQPPTAARTGFTVIVHPPDHDRPQRRYRAPVA